MRLLLLIIVLIVSAGYSNAQFTKVPVDVSVKSADGSPIQGEQIWIQEVNRKLVFKGVSDESGNFHLEIDGPGMYMIKIKSVGEARNYQQFSVPKLGPNESYGTYNIGVIIEPTKVFTLDNVYFEFASAELQEESFAELDELVELMQLKQSMEVEIGGHTDQRGSDEYNLKLSQDRANSVKKYLVSKGIEEGRITAVGYGESKPIAIGSDNDDHIVSRNRRTEVKILKE